MAERDEVSATDIAIIGLAGRFPGARDVASYWQDAVSGREAVSFLTSEDLEDVPPALRENPNYVPAKGVLDDAEMFDAGFFRFSPREADVLDPQHRVFLETAWHALEDAGVDPEATTARVGVFGGSSMSTYAMRLLQNAEVAGAAGDLQILLSNDKDYLTTRTSYKLSLTGPSVAVQSACSTSLVAVHIACQSLLADDCDVALAGGVSVSVPLRGGFMYDRGGILSPDGHCRPFASDARGTVPGNGVAIVVLKPLTDALAAEDHIYAVIKGSAVNNDGAAKVGYTAPSVERQADVIRDALAVSDVDPSTIAYIETHGTGTALGDPVEVAALRAAFSKVEKGAVCALGSVKAQIGHLDAAAGVAGLIKATLAVRQGILPPSPHVVEVNPDLGLDDSPFYVNRSAAPWPESDMPRRAGVSSFGIGGTNAHVILEESPLRSERGSSDGPRLLLFSGLSPEAVARTRSRVLDHVSRHGTNLSDVAYTLQTGRKHFRHRHFSVVSEDEGLGEAHVHPSHIGDTDEPRSVVFVFPGQGTSFLGWGRDLYLHEAEFKRHFDACADGLVSVLGLDLRKILFPDHGSEAAHPDLSETWLTQPALFALEYALARQWMSWGIEPDCMIGHSVGEYVAACLADVFSLDDALAIVARRGSLMQRTEPGRMLAVATDESTVREFLADSDLEVAAVNSPRSCTVAGLAADISRLEEALNAQGIASQMLAPTRAFHSRLMAPMLDSLSDEIATRDLNSPRIPFISDVSGTWASSDEVRKPAYWATHARSTVRFADGISRIVDEHRPLFVEVGPGRSLSRLVVGCVGDSDRAAVPSLLVGAEAGLGTRRGLLNVLGALWLHGVGADWRAVTREGRLVSLPGYSFERERHWVDLPAEAGFGDTNSEELVTVSSEVPRNSTDDAASRDGDLSIAVTTIWEEVLGIGDASVNDDFFVAGGNSLMAVQLVSLVRTRLGVDLALEEFFESPLLAKLIDMVSRREEPDTSVRIQAVDRDAFRVTTSADLSDADEQARGEHGIREVSGGRRNPSTSLFFFSALARSGESDAYRLVLDASRLADRNGFEAVWTPERHFHAFGGLYPNPSLLAAGIATATSRVGVRAGSVVLPLHNPIRVAEDWAVVDNLSSGRVGVSFAPGFHADDFVLAPRNFADRKDVMLRGIETVQALWRGEALKAERGSGDLVEVEIYPKPVQPELPTWLTAAVNPETFVAAGRVGANVLTALLNLSIDDLEGRVALYRQSRADNGFDPATGRVTLMVHTFVGDDLERVREQVRRPFYEYLWSHSELVKSEAKRVGVDIDVDNLPEADRDALLKFAFQRYFDHSSLMGDQAKVSATLAHLREVGVDEVACLIDFGLDFDTVMEGLERLSDLHERPMSDGS